MQNLIEILKYISESNIINFCLMIWLLVYLCKKIDLGSVLNGSVKNVENYIEKSKTEMNNSKNMVLDSEKLLSKLPSQIEEIQKFSAQKSEIFKKQLEESTKKSIEKINANISRVVEIEEKKISAKVMDYSFNKSINKAKNEIESMLESNPQLHDKFIEDSLCELEKI